MGKSHSHHDADLKCLLLGGIVFDGYIVLRANGKIDWMVRNFISREANVLLKIYKSLIRLHIKYCIKAWAPGPRH